MPDDREVQETVGDGLDAEAQATWDRLNTPITDNPTAEALRLVAVQTVHSMRGDYTRKTQELASARRTHEEKVRADEEQLAREGIQVHQSSRGGNVTYHGPGQLVAYPILRLDLHGRDIHRYLRDLEEVLIRLLTRFGVEGRRSAGLTGVWVGDEKIAAIGVAVSRWVTYHGFALNVTPDLGHFGLIVPCGIRDKGVTSLARLLAQPVTVAEVKPPLVECVVEVFGFDGAVAAADGPVD